MKKFICMAVIFCSVFACTMAVADNAENPDYVYMQKSTSDVLFEGNDMYFADSSGEPLSVYTYNDITYVPLRSFAESMGKTVSWNEELNRINIKNKQPDNAGKVFGSYIYGGDTLPRVSIIQLLANPEKYNNQKVNVQGFISVEFELDRLFLTREDMEYINKPNSLGLNIRTRNPLNVPIEELEEISGSFVEMEGTFTYDEYSMNLYDVTYIYCVPKY